MISGLLSTLNEDAHEDILVEELINSTTGAAAAYLGGSNDSLVSSASNYSTSNQPKEAEVNINAHYACSNENVAFKCIMSFCR